MRRVIPNDATLVPDHAECVFKGVIYDVYQWDQQLFDGSHATFEMLKRPDTVKTIAIKDNAIIMLDEQQPHGGRGFELPGGRHDVPSEDELACAKRELQEETGMSFKNWRLLSVYQPAPKIEAFVYIFLATEFLEQTTPHTDAGEKITLHPVSFDTFLSLARDPRHGTYLPLHVLDQAGSLQGLLQLPSYSNKNE